MIDCLIDFVSYVLPSICTSPISSHFCVIFINIPPQSNTHPRSIFSSPLLSPPLPPLPQRASWSRRESSSGLEQTSPGPKSDARCLRSENTLAAAMKWTQAGEASFQIRPVARTATRLMALTGRLRRTGRLAGWGSRARLALARPATGPSRKGWPPLGQAARPLWRYRR